MSTALPLCDLLVLKKKTFSGYIRQEQKLKESRNEARVVN